MVTSEDLLLILFLALLEGLLSVDNALVLALLSRQLPKEQRTKALTYGLWGSFLFRVIAVWVIFKIIEWTWIKYVGGGYLLLLAIRHIFKSGKEKEETLPLDASKFWKVIVFIELADIAFALDSILAAVALSNKYWVVLLGGCIGVVMMRIASGGFLKLMDRFPGVEKSAYYMIAVIGAKLILEASHLPGVDFQSSSNPASWTFWILLFACFLFGFKKSANTDDHKA